MDERSLYQQITDFLRQQVLDGHLKSGDQLPPIRQLAKQWNCTLGTVQHAYQELVKQGIVISRPGQGTRVVERPALRDDAMLRKAALVHKAESYLLEAVNTGYTAVEAEQALRLAMDRWRIIEQAPKPLERKILRFSGSHDLAIAWMASHYEEIDPTFSLHLNFSGSLGGLIALAEGKSDLAGCHLWDEESNEYNVAYVRKLLPGKTVALVTLAERNLGLVLPPDNPQNVRELADLIKPGVIFINRQSGSGTRVWLDFQLKKIGIDIKKIKGFSNERSTHSEIAQEIADGNASAGLGLEAAARGFGLDFIFLTRERYELIIPKENFERPGFQRLVAWLQKPAAVKAVNEIGGYETTLIGQVRWCQ
jgi:molybdate-binding protein/DNA-binding transcriptional regulator YhcF (GntR family)